MNCKFNVGEVLRHVNRSYADHQRVVKVLDIALCSKNYSNYFFMYEVIDLVSLFEYTVGEAELVRLLPEIADDISW